MSGIDKRACRAHLELCRTLDPNNGLLHVPSVCYVICTEVRLIAHRRILLLHLCSREQAAAGISAPTYTVFQASNEFITYDHREESKTRWRTSVMAHLERTWEFYRGCAFYSKEDEDRVVRFCRRISKIPEVSDGFTLLEGLQNKIRDDRALKRRRQKQREIMELFRGLRPLPADLERWEVREVLLAYFFYDHRKGKTRQEGVCSACGSQIALEDVRHNATGECPCCKRTLTMKSKRRGRLLDRATVSIVQKMGDDALIVRIVKTFCTYPKQAPRELSTYEAMRVVVRQTRSGQWEEATFHSSGQRGDLTPWKSGHPHVMNLYQENFYADTCGYLYCRNLDRELRNTRWQYCQLEDFYQGLQSMLQVSPYLAAYPSHPALEYCVKLRLYWLAVYIAYKSHSDMEPLINSNGKNLREILQIDPAELPYLQQSGAGVWTLRLLRMLRQENVRPSDAFISWIAEQNLIQVELFRRPLHYMTQHKLMRYIDRLCERTETTVRYGGLYHDTISDYNDYLDFCEQLQYDLTDDFVLFPKNLKQAHDQAKDMIAVQKVERYDAEIAAQQQELIKRYRFKKNGLVVMPPRSAQEIVSEGQRLHHCVGGYAERMARKECIVLFIRQETEPDTPFYTVQVDEDHIVQTRGKQNCSPTDEVRQFLDAWKKARKLDSAA